MKFSSGIIFAVASFSFSFLSAVPVTMAHNAEETEAKTNIRSSSRKLAPLDKISICHLYREESCGLYYKTLDVSANAAKGHANHGDYIDGGCGEPGVCAEICGHQPCFDDYLVGEDICVCFGSGSYLCGPNTECSVNSDTNEESCECLEGFEDITGEGASNPNQGCTLTPAPTPGPTPEPTPGPTPTPATPGDGCFYQCPEGTSFTPISGVDGVENYYERYEGFSVEIQLPFLFNWLNDRDISSVWLTFTGVLNPSKFPIDGYWDRRTVPIEIGDVYTNPRLSIVNKAIGGYPPFDLLVLDTTSPDEESVIISYEGAKFYYGIIGAGELNAQVKLFSDGRFNICYGNGELYRSFPMAAGIEDETINVAYPAETFPTNAFGTDGITNVFPANKCACFNPDCRDMNQY